MRDVQGRLHKFDFYRSVRDTIHAEVNSWNGAGPHLSAADIDGMWAKIEHREAESRNPDATVLPAIVTSCESPTGHDFVNVSRLTLSAGVNLG